VEVAVERAVVDASPITALGHLAGFHLGGFHVILSGATSGDAEGEGRDDETDLEQSGEGRERHGGTLPPSSGGAGRG